MAPKRKTHEEFLREVEMHGDHNEYSFQEEYETAVKKIRVKHKCGHTYKVAPTKFLKGSRCPKCFKKVKRSEEVFLDEVRGEVGDEYVFKESYVNNKTKIKVKHNIEDCGYEYRVTPANFFQGNRCPRCAINKRALSKRLDDREFRYKVLKVLGREYEILGRYERAIDRVRVKHKKCGREWESLPGNLMRGNGCLLCARKETGKSSRMAQDEFKERVVSLVGSEYTFLEKYKGSKVKLEIRHNDCGHHYKIAPNTFFKGRRCPECRYSKGEQAIKEELTKLNLEFIREYGIPTERRLKLDFFIPKNKLAIEFDGEQHYHPLEFFGGLPRFNRQQENDDMKDKYCKEHGIKLLRIPYWNITKIPEIVTKEINAPELNE